jgi:hypothetical protein
MEITTIHDREKGNVYQIKIMVEGKPLAHIQYLTDKVQKLVRDYDAELYYANARNIVVFRDVKHPNLQHMIDAIIDLEHKFEYGE